MNNSMGNLEPLDWLDTALLDLTITRLKYKAYSSEYAWAKWVRE